AAYTGTIYEKKDPGRVWFSGGVIDSFSLVARHFTEPPTDSTAARSTEFITGCCLLFRSDALKTIGLLDTCFFAYYEDVDWCLRARVAGSRLLYVPQATIYHEVSHSFRRAGSNRDRSPRFSWAQKTPLVLFLTYRNRLLLYRRHSHGLIHKMFLFAKCGARAALHVTLLTITGQFDRARAVATGYRDGCLGAPPTYGISRFLGKPVRK